MFIIKYERKTQPMKKILSLSPILLTLTWIIVLSVLVGCTTVGKTISTNSCDNSHTNSKVYQNVAYSFDVEKHFYYVGVEYNMETHKYDKIYNVPPSNFYEIKLSEYAYTSDHRVLDNEYFVSTNELFVYYVK